MKYIIRFKTNKGYLGMCFQKREASLVLSDEKDSG